MAVTIKDFGHAPFDDASVRNNVLLVVQRRKCGVRTVFRGSPLPVFENKNSEHLQTGYFPTLSAVLSVAVFRQLHFLGQFCETLAGCVYVCSIFSYFFERIIESHALRVALPFDAIEVERC